MAREGAGYGRRARRLLRRARQRGSAPSAEYGSVRPCAPTMPAVHYPTPPGVAQPNLPFGAYDNYIQLRPRVSRKAQCRSSAVIYEAEVNSCRASFSLRKVVWTLNSVSRQTGQPSCRQHSWITDWIAGTAGKHLAVGTLRLTRKSGAWEWPRTYVVSSRHESPRDFFPDEHWRISYRIACVGVPDTEFSIVMAVEDGEFTVRLEG
jgi:hypothetical protein